MAYKKDLEQFVRYITPYVMQKIIERKTCYPRPEFNFRSTAYNKIEIKEKKTGIVMEIGAVNVHPESIIKTAPWKFCKTMVQVKIDGFLALNVLHVNGSADVLLTELIAQLFEWKYGCIDLADKNVIKDWI